MKSERISQSEYYRAKNSVLEALDEFDVEADYSDIENFIELYDKKFLINASADDIYVEFRDFQKDL